MENFYFLQNRTLSNAITKPAVVDFRALSARLPFRNVYLGGKDVITLLYFPFLAFGVVSNILNIVVYTRIGVKDNMTVSFLTLSISDLLYLVLLSPHITADALTHLVEDRLGKTIPWLFHDRILRFPFYWYAFTFYETSILINVYISVVRCACVAIPFTVKSMFTVRRAIIAFVVFFLSIFALRFPMFMTKRIVQEYDPVTNKTRFMYREIEDGGLADKLNDIVSRNILSWISFMTVIICLVIMVFKLQASAKFRSSLSTGNSSSSGYNKEVCNAQESDQLEATPSKANVFDKDRSKSNNIDTFKGYPSSDQETNDLEAVKDLSTKLKASKKKKAVSTLNGGNQMLSSKEAQVVRSVVLVACVFIMCQTPFMAYTLARQIEPKFDDVIQGDVSRYIFIFGLCSNMSTIFAMINASVNIIVYYNFNSRYRSCIKSLLKRG
ncbi:hypothetical protein RRG08_011473 [Elysia crispata]|uniref:G-protein coupled receptors family 1 profile domain-containing protein n=1 Tax=Elysia crispata TaxID=231223 RepID=A0AAE0XMN1_9GAST|nr:hypothetical protein RRG08_011473 [Elysia crispata]